ncbi:MAG: hypothetical protein LQ338_002614 [Usnochroma carphineum]|nr:MAG: hypothetical protein LQ338_002614 [Usnochroma carphineum]
MESLFAYQVLIPASDIQDSSSPLPIIRKDKSFTNHDPFLDTAWDEDLDFFNNTGTMAGTSHSSPYIKDEPDDYPFSAQTFPTNQQGYNMQTGHQLGGNAPGSIDPSELTMQNSNFNQYNLGSQQHISGGFNPGGSFVNDDELLDFDLNDPSTNQGQFQGGQPGFDQHQGSMNMPQSFHQTQPSMGGLNQMNQMYSNTPETAQTQSPFVHGNFNYAQYQVNHTSPRTRPVQGASLDSSFMPAGQRTHMPQAMDRQLSSSRSPMTPKTPGVSGLNMGTPESGSLPSQPIPSNYNQHRHQKSLSAQWDSTPGSLPSYGDSPLSSPGHTVTHNQISEIMKASGGKHASSLPAKVDNHQAVPAYQSQEAKRRRRRISHNMVERRRRDNINERIQELSHLVPMHRLEDEKVRKHIVNNTPLSPSLVATGRSPPAATSLLAGGGRRATTAGSISMGIPLEDKDKGPNKGDILNGAVSWTRDLMWALHIKIQQESELADLITSLGGRWPFEQTEDEKRMRTELLSAMADNNPSTFSYTRGPGTGLRVPNHTNHAGEPLNPNQMGTMSPQSLSPGVQSGGSGANSGGVGQPQFWSHDGHGFKEEDEYGMEMN